RGNRPTSRRPEGDVRYCDPLSYLPHACADRAAHRHNQICIPTKHILSASVPSMQEVAQMETEGCVGTERRKRSKIRRRVTPRKYYLANNLFASSGDNLRPIMSFGTSRLIQSDCRV